MHIRERCQSSSLTADHFSIFDSQPGFEEECRCCLRLDSGGLRAYLIIIDESSLFPPVIEPHRSFTVLYLISVISLPNCTPQSRIRIILFPWFIRQVTAVLSCKSEFCCWPKGSDSHTLFLCHTMLNVFFLLVLFFVSS